MIEELIKIDKTMMNGEEVNSVNMRDVYTYLEVKSKFSDWVKREIESLMLEENIDYVWFLKKKKANNATLKECVVKMDIAKMVCMQSRTKKGKEAKEYFIQVEKIAKNYLGEEKLKLELKKLTTEEMLLQEDIIDKRVARVQLLQSMGVNFDATTLIDSGKCKSVLDKDTSEALTSAYSDIRTGVQVFSATHLLNANKVDTRTKDFNDAMIQANLMEKYTYKGTTYKKMTTSVNYYGYNRDASSVKKMPYQVRYYEDRFMDLVQLLRNEGYID
jgi:phage anti-repressor protein